MSFRPVTANTRILISSWTLLLQLSTFLEKERTAQVTGKTLCTLKYPFQLPLLNIYQKYPQCLDVALDKKVRQTYNLNLANIEYKYHAEQTHLKETQKKEQNNI